MHQTVVVHVVAGSLGLLSGFVAIAVAKGEVLHRSSGMVFVPAMLTMGISGAAIAALTSVEISVIAGMTTAYLAFTGWTTMRHPGSRRVAVAALAVGLVLGLTSAVLGLHTVLVSADGTRDGLPSFPFFVMAVPALLGSAGDFRMLRSGSLTGRRRLARHLWRMCYALFIASLSFFLGQTDEIPEALRITPILVTLALLPAVVMLYWLWRVRRRGAPLTHSTLQSVETTRIPRVTASR